MKGALREEHSTLQIYRAAHAVANHFSMQDLTFNAGPHSLCINTSHDQQAVIY